MKIDWSPFVAIVRSHQRFVLTTHVRPDCDALGSELALSAALRSLGKEVCVCNGFAVPPNLEFLDPEGRLGQLGKDFAAERLADFEVLIVLDTTAWAQLAPVAELIRSFPGRKVAIDHHTSGDDLGAELFKDPQAEATCRLVVEAADALGVPLSAEMAGAALAGLATDTGWFRFASTSAETLRLAARLVEAGAKPDWLYKKLYEEETLARLRLIGHTMARAQSELGGRLVHTWMERADFEQTGALSSDSEDVINMLLTVGGSEMAMILIELPTGKFKLSLRSRCAVDCARLAAQFGGGGHRNAAGATLDGPLRVAQQKVLDAVRAAMG